MLQAADDLVRSIFSFKKTCSTSSLLLGPLYFSLDTMCFENRFKRGAKALERQTTINQIIFNYYRTDSSKSKVLWSLSCEAALHSFFHSLCHIQYCVASTVETKHSTVALLSKTFFHFSGLQIWLYWDQVQQSIAVHPAIIEFTESLDYGYRRCWSE